MHIVKINPEVISIETGNTITQGYLYGMDGDLIGDLEKIQYTISHVISKHEQTIAKEISSVVLICDILDLQFTKTSRSLGIEENSERINTNSFVLKTCKLHETYNSQAFKLLINCFTDIGINVSSAISSIGLFILNSQKLINQTRSYVMFIGRKKTILLSLDGAGGISNITECQNGLGDIQNYISSIAQTQTLEKNISSVILKNFIHFSELEMIENIHNIKHINSKVMSSLNYQLVQAVSSAAKTYLEKLLSKLRIPDDDLPLLYYTQEDYQKSFSKIFGMITGRKTIYMQQHFFAKPKNPEEQNNNFIKDLLKIFTK